MSTKEQCYLAYEQGRIAGKLYAELKQAYAEREMVEVVHGYWRDSFRDADTCSRCRYTIPKHEYGHKYAYCPHCGAKMDGE